MTESQGTNRRQFLSTAATAGAAAWAGTARGYSAGASAQPGPNDTINMALIGCGARGGNQVMPEFAKLPGVRVTALCDINSANLERIRQRLDGGPSVATYKDYRKLLEDKSIDAVIIATQAHWHALPMIAACQAGKDVYLEKPIGNMIGEGRYVIEAAKKYNRIVQVGTQQRSQEHYQKAVELIQRGGLGNIAAIDVWDHSYLVPGRGFPADCDPPAELDWDFYVGPATMRPYNPNIYANYGYDWFKLSGAGHQLAWGVHHYDIVCWAMGVKHPKRITAMGGQLAYKDNTEFPNTFNATLEFGPGPVAKNGFIMNYAMRLGGRRVARAHAKCFYGDEASMLLDRSGYSIVAEIKDDKKTPNTGNLIGPEEEVAAADDKFRHVAVFIQNMRDRTQPFASCEANHHATNLGHLMNIAWETGRSIEWDGENEKVVGDDEANALIMKPYRAPWKLEV